MRAPCHWVVRAPDDPGAIACAVPRRMQQDGAPNMISRRFAVLKMRFTGRLPKACKIVQKIGNFGSHFKRATALRKSF